MVSCIAGVFGTANETDILQATVLAVLELCLDYDRNFEVEMSPRSVISAFHKRPYTTSTLWFFRKSRV